jgi:predicted PurR-regulated permease PerM
MKEENNPLKIEISHKTVIFIAAFAIGLWLIVQLTSIIIVLVLSFILLSALLKPVQWLTSKNIPRIISVLIIYIIIILLIGVVIGTILPPLISQTTEFSSKLPQIISSTDNYIIFHRIPVENLSTIMAKQINQFSGDLVVITSKVVSSVVLVVTMFVLTLYLLLDWKNLIKVISSPFSGVEERRIINIISKVEDGLGRWVRGQLLLSLVVGVLTYIGLTIIGIPYALPLALIAGILEVLPIVGPIIAAIPAILVGLTISPIMAVAAAATFLIVQQLENHLVVPVVMSRVVGVRPPIIIISLLIGAKLAGITGAFLAIPIIVVIKILTKELLNEEEQLEESLLE